MADEKYTPPSRKNKKAVTAFMAEPLAQEFKDALYLDRVTLTDFFEDSARAYLKTRNAKLKRESAS